MERRVVNPWTWQDEFAFVQANEVSGVRRALICSGQTSLDADGQPLHAGDMRAQISQALDNLETVLREGGFTLADVVRLNYYTTDMDAFLANHHILEERLRAAGCRSAGTLLGITRFSVPECMIELEATAMV
jgi:enamine deaminase RidA (YjgF/YER057c/UK114 family)